MFLFSMKIRAFFLNEWPGGSFKSEKPKSPESLRTDVKMNLQELEKKLQPLDSSAKEELQAINDALKNEKDPIKIRSLKRDKMRILQFELMRSKNNTLGYSPDQISAREAILNGNSYQSLSRGDMLLLQKRGIDVRKILLAHDSSIDESLGDTSISNESFQPGSRLVVNFWKNASLNKRMGIGDILPPTVKEITVIPNNSQETQRYSHKERVPRTGVFSLTPRPGYYDAGTNPSNKTYIPVYDGDTIMIHSNQEMSPENLQKHQDALDNETMKARRFDVNTGKKLTNLPEDIEAYESNDAIGSEGEFINKYHWVINESCAKFSWIPPRLVVQLIKIETGGTFDPQSSPKEYGNPETAWAYGLGQHIKSTWDAMNKKYFSWTLDRTNPVDQIKATCAYLHDVKTEKNCDWAQAVIYYHTGTGVTSAHIPEYKRSNPAIARKMRSGDNSLEGYMQAAAELYQVSGYANQAYNDNTALKPIESLNTLGKPDVEKFINSARAWMGTPYDFGWNSESWIDCSHFVCKALVWAGLTPSFYQTAAGLYRMTKEHTKDMQDVQRWDLIFWHWGERWVSHVAIALGPVQDGKVKVIDASGKRSGDGKVNERVISLQSNFTAASIV